MGAAWFAKDIKPASPKPKKSISDEQVLPWDVDPDDVGLQDIDIDMVDSRSHDVAEYCIPLLVVHFCGQTSSIAEEASTDESKSIHKKVLTLKNYLKMLDRWLRQYESVTDFTGEEEEYKLILRLIAMKRFRDNFESVDECYKRLLRHSKRFVKIYHKRGRPSLPLEHNTYWGTRQQLLAGKVIGDWIDRENGPPLDPIFGVLLNPTAGRVGPGDSGWFHDILFDDRGHFAYHSAVHDGFGYLINNHDVGPGYDYLHGSTFFDTNNCLAGQVPGLSFWSHVIEEVETKKKVLEHWRC